MRILLTFLLMTAVSTSYAQDPDEAMIRKILADQTIAWNNGNLEQFMSGYWQNDSLEFIGKNGPTYGWTNTLNNYKRGYPDTATMGKLWFDIVSVKKLSADYSYVTGKWNLKRSVGDVGGMFTLLFRKIKGTWFIIADHSS